jgi:two-component system response regulator YesN
MYDILLVDDEPLHLSGLSAMLRRLRPEYGIYTARNGREALEKCGARSFQIIITDIMMPQMDGLHFLEQLAPQATPRRVIYLSGYSHFEYAQQAMSLGSFEYMLKPLDPLKLSLVLEKVEKSLRQELAALEKYERLAVRADAAEPAYRQRLFNQWIEGKLHTAEDEAELKHILGFSGCGSLLVVSLEGEREQTPEAVIELLRAYGVCAGYACRQDSGLLAAAISGGFPARELHQALVELGLTAGISTPADDLIESVTRAYAEARHAAIRVFYAEAGDTHVYYAAEGGLDASRKLTSDSRLVSLLSEAVMGWDGGKGLEAAAGEAVRQLLGEEAPPMPEELIREMRQLLFNVIYSLDGLREEEQRGLLQQASAIADSLSGQQQLIAAAAGLLENVARYRAEAKQERKAGVLSRCLDYIDAHYTEDLSQEAVASMFHFNSSYFCQLFKSRVNMTFNQYVTRLRLDHAKAMLASSTVKVYRVAEQLGYHDVKYFNRVFKKETGLTPEEFRSLTRSLTEV